jgi:hypothetical protein
MAKSEAASIAPGHKGYYCGLNGSKELIRIHRSPDFVSHLYGTFHPDVFYVNFTSSNCSQY